MKEFGLVCRRWFAVSIFCLFSLTGSPALGEAVADPTDDPWLSEQGPAIAKPAEVSRERTIEAWTGSPRAAYARASALRRVRLEFGLGDLLAPARVMLKHSTEEDPEIYTGFALDLAPTAPSIQIEHARALAASGDIGAATKALGTGLWSVVVNLSAQLWVVENFSLLVLIVVMSASLGFISLAAFQVFPHAAHDLGDLLAGRHMPNFARSATLIAILMLPFALGEGVIGMAVALFTLAFVYGKARGRNILVMAAVLLVIGLHPVAQFASIATTLVEEDPIAKSVMAVVAGTESRADVERLEAVVRDDLAAGHALALRARRYGLEELSRKRLETLSERYPSDGFVLAARGNIEKRRGNAEAALGLYERAAAQVDSAVLLFDLSQAYASEFRMEEYEATLVRAQRIDGEAVSALSSFGDSDLVADLLFPSSLLRDRFISGAMSQNPQFDLAAVLAPGRLGDRWFSTACAFALAALFGLLFGDRFDHASRCGRCGHRICTRCEETVWSDDICEDCHHLFKYPVATDPSLRMARLQALSKREARIDRIALAGALLIPGVAGLAARRSDFAMFGLLLFGWIAAWAAWPAGVLEDPLLMGHAAVIYLAVPGVLSVIGYGGVVVASLAARRNR